MKTNYIILDVETGGLSKQSNPITQVGLIVVDGKSLAVLDEYETYVKPYNDLEITKKAIEATRVSMADINNGIDAVKLVAKLIEIFKKHTPKNTKTEKPVLVGHNIPFDLGFLEELFKWRSKDLYDFIDTVPRCTMRMMKEYERNTKGDKLYNLTSCCERFGITLKSAHGAMDDCLVTLDLFRSLMKNFTSDTKKKVVSGVVDLKESTVKSRKFFELP